jgi:hypothetical protein
MKKFLVVFVIAVGVLLGIRQIASSKGPDLTITGDEVLLATGDLDYRFSKGKSFDGTYMIFGGDHTDHRNAISNVILAGLNVRDAKRIHQRYPDFHRCASPGAALAKDKIVDLQMVPTDGKTLATLRSSIDEFKDSIQNDGDRVCVQLHGSRLKLTSAEVREVGESVTETIKMTNFYLIDSASHVECQQVLAGG